MNTENVDQNKQVNNPLHGLKLAAILEALVDYYGWEKLSMKIRINCFKNDPSLNSSLKFLRKTPWARDQVEQLYLDLIKKKQFKQASSQRTTD